MKPLPLAAFEPYYQGPLQVRVYQTTIESTSQWWAKDNMLQGRIQLALGNLQEGDLSIRGVALVDLKRVAGSQTPQLRGELDLSGPLDHPKEWRALFIPGVNRLLERGVKAVHIAPWQNKIQLSSAQTSKEAMVDIEMVSKEVQEALEILAKPEPILEPQPETATPPTLSTPPTPEPPGAQPATAPPVESPPSSVPDSSSVPPSTPQPPPESQPATPAP